MPEPMPIQWFPGHMAKTRRIIQADLKLVDVVVELLDARIPAASRNPEIDRLIQNKPRIIALNKADIADGNANRQWRQYYAKRTGFPTVLLDAKSGKGVKELTPAVETALAEELSRRAKRGMSGKPVRMMIVGVPNVGKSSLINRLAGSRRTKVEDRPGVTRGRQWVSVGTGMEVLDTPGVLWPKFEDPYVGELLAYTGAIKDQILDVETLASRLLDYLARHYSPLLAARYKLEVEPGEEPVALLERLGRKRGMLLSGGHVDTERAAVMLLDEFRGGVIGRISLEWPDQEQNKGYSGQVEADTGE